ncbi:MAG: tRNA lysidine(34) synthetase TilS [Deltaproteobacteria bacterium]|nr:tRNA lysidine(34) synthetase TilS [Deltaproteobacteria bacterium]
MLIKKIEQTINKNHLLNDGDVVVVALSGGADSCALLMSLAGLAPIRRLKLVAAHFNHGLRQAESDEDEEFCRSLAEKLNLPFESERMREPNVPKGMSPEDYFRRERYSFLEKVAERHGARKIALGHHLQDQAETVLLNMLRGSGLHGLKGFEPMRDNKFIRPLMEVTRKEIQGFLAQSGTGHRDDSSNDNPIYLRNRIRKELIPFLKERYNPKIEGTLARTAEIMRTEDAFLTECVNVILSTPDIERKREEASVCAEKLKSLHAALRFRIIKTLLESIAPAGKGFSLVHIQLVDNLLAEHSSGKKIALPYNLCAENEYGRVVFRKTNGSKRQNYNYTLSVPGVIDLEERCLILSLRRGTPDEIDFHSKNTSYFDEDKIKKPLILRNRQNGDWFEPLGTKGSQKIKKLFIDRKIPKDERQGIALIADQESVIWIENMHMSERVKVAAGTKNVLILEIRRPPEVIESAEENN